VFRTVLTLRQFGGAGGRNAVLLGANYFSNNDPSFQQNTLLHELLHAYTHWDDKEIFAAFAGYGLKNIHGGTIDIADWLKNDCKFTDKALPIGVSVKHEQNRRQGDDQMKATELLKVLAAVAAGFCRRPNTYFSFSCGRRVRQRHTRPAY